MACRDSTCLTQLVADLGMANFHSRRQVSGDNPFSEAQFNRAKYHATCPEPFGSLVVARAWARILFQWYNAAHHVSEIGRLVPATVRHAHAPAVEAPPHV